MPPCAKKPGAQQDMMPCKGASDHCCSLLMRLPTTSDSAMASDAIMMRESASMSRCAGGMPAGKFSETPR
eukprot:1432953-Prymnesium_polylepis.1